MVQVAPLIPAKRTVTEVRKLSFFELLTHLGIPTAELSEVHISTEKSQKTKTGGDITIVTKTETEA